MHADPLHPALHLTFWLLVLGIGALMLRQACSLLGEDMPSYPRAFVSVLLVGSAAFFTFDLTGYGILQTLRGEILQVPPGYGYTHWLQEPLALKWRVTGTIPFVRYIPIVFALCAAGALQVFALELQVPFRRALLLFLMQWAATLLTVALLSVAIDLVQGQLAEPAPPPGYRPDQPTQNPSEARPFGTFLEKAREEAEPLLDQVKEGSNRSSAGCPTRPGAS